MSAAVETQSLPTGTWNLDPIHSQVGFAVEYVIGTFRGSFSPVDAKLDVAEDGTARLTGSVPVKGVKVQDENLTTHLESPEFFDAERTPQISFESSRLERSGDEVTVDGDLTIRGVSVPVQAKGTITDPADDPYGGVRFGLHLEATIDRTKYGISWNNPMPNGKPSLGNAVTLSADLVLVRA
jgi:polyisoprenoid-binding protein YceI